MKHIPLALIILVGSSCATLGRRIDTTRIDTLKEGVSTKEDAIKLLGQPTTTSVGSSTTILVWMYAHEGALGSRETTIIQLVFDASGILAKKTTFGTHAKY